MNDKDKQQQQATINVWGIANIGCEMENPTFQTLVVSPEEQILAKQKEQQDKLEQMGLAVKKSLEEPRTQNIYGDKNEFQDGAQLLKMGIPDGADPAEIAARIAEQQRALLEQKKQKK